MNWTPSCSFWGTGGTFLKSSSVSFDGSAMLFPIAFSTSFVQAASVDMMLESSRISSSNRSYSPWWVVST